MRNSGKAKGRTFVRPLLMTRFIRLHPGAQKGDATNLGRCPSRAASKTSMPTLNGQRNLHSLTIQTRLAVIWFKINEDFFNYFGRGTQPAEIPDKMPPDSCFFRRFDGGNDFSQIRY